MADWRKSLYTLPMPALLESRLFDSRYLAPASGIGIRVAFVQPKIPDGNYLPNLGIMVLASLLIKDGFEVRVFDANLQNDMMAALAAFRPHLAGFTCVTAALKSSAEMAAQLKAAVPDCITMAGGPHVSAVPRETLEQNAAFDFCLQGEAEISLRDFCRKKFLEKKETEIESIPGLIFRREGKVLANRPAAFLEGDGLDELPFPAWHLLPMEQIFSKVTHGLFSRGKRIMPVMTSRGCPNYCGFCCRVMGFKFRTQSLARVLTEVQWLFESYRIDEVYFEDDTFTQDPVRAHELLDGLISLRLPIHIKFANGLRADKVDRALLEKMKAAGVYWVGFGIESGSPHTQKLMRKFLDLDLAARNVKLAKELGFRVGSNCIIGYPGETKQSIRESIAYFLRLRLDSFAVVTCVPFPGTTAWQECEKNSWFTDHARDYANYWFEVFKVTPLIETPHLSARDLSRAIFLVYVRFYFLNPARFLLVARMVLKKHFANAIPISRWMRLLRSNSMASGAR